MKKVMLVCMLIIGTIIPNDIHALFVPNQNISDEVQYEPGKLIIKYKLTKTARRKSIPSSIRDEHEMILEALRNSIEDFPEVKIQKDGMNTKPVHSALVRQMIKSNKSESAIINRIQNKSLRKRRRRLKKKLSANRYRRSRKFVIEFVDKKVDVIKLQRTIEDIKDFGELPIQEITALPNYILRICAVPNDPRYPEQWGLEKISAAQAWDVTKGDSGIIIAIIDTGVFYTHKDLKDKIWINEDEVEGNGEDNDDNGYVDDVRGYSFTANPDNDTNDPKDTNSHGTHVAGIAAASTDNYIGIAGVARECKIMAIKVDWSIIAIKKAIAYAVDNGADVINMSFGMYTEEPILVDIIDEAYKQGVVLVAAAGNSPTSDEMYPAATKKVIAVAATNPQDKRSSFSAFGEWVDLAAPGSEIFSTVPGGYAYHDGTSMAAPFVAGAAALLLSLNDKLTPEEVRDLLRESADPIVTDKDIGAGRLNLYKTVNDYLKYIDLGLNINITNLKKNRNYLASDDEISFGCYVSHDNLSEMRVILTDLVNGNKVNLIDPNPEVEPVEADLYSRNEYQHSWEGSELSSLNDGEYTYEIKALHDYYGEGSSRKQAFSWSVHSDAEVSTGKNYDSGIYNKLNRYESAIIYFEIRYPPEENEDVHILEPKERDFDSSPEVATELLSWDVNDNSDTEWILWGSIKATNTSPDIESFIIDRQPPTIISNVEPEYFSPVVTDASQITCTITDNLPFILKDVSVRVYDENNNVVRILYEVDSDVQGTNRFNWDGTGSDAHNGGAVVADGRYTYIIRAKDFAGNPSEYTGVIVVDSVVPELVGQNIAVIPAEHPHPDTFTTNDEKIEFSYLTADNLCPSVNIEIHFIAGEEEPSTVLVRESNFPITNVLQSVIYDWDGKDDAGNFLPDNHYTVVLYAEDLAGNRTTEVILGEFEIDRIPSVPETLYVDNFIFTPDDGEGENGDGFKDTVTLHYLLTDNAHVSIEIEDILGRTIAVLDQGADFKIEDEIMWDGRADGEYVSDGHYIFRIKTKDDVWNIAYASLPVIKNQVPAEILFPEDGGEDYSRVSGVVTVKGIALDPGIHNSQDFRWYKVWYREGSEIDFNNPENNPLNPDTNIWHPIVVPASYQNAEDPQYPGSNVSYRAVNYTKLADWDTQGLSDGGLYTLLLVTEDEGGHSSFDWRTVQVDHTFDTTSPEIEIVSPSPMDEFEITSETNRLNIFYSLQQEVEKQANISAEIFRMDEQGAIYGRIVFHQEYFNITESEPFQWDGRNFQRQYVENGRYRIRLTCRDTDRMGMNFFEQDIMVDVILTQPLEIITFSVLNSIIEPGQTVDITYHGSKEARVTISIYDSSDNLIETLVNNIVTPGEIDRITHWTAVNEGLYECKLYAISTDDYETECESSLPISVTGSGSGQGTAEISYPEEGEVTKGSSNFTWTALSTGEHYPPQAFTADVEIQGLQTWIQNVTDHSSDWTLDEENVIVQDGIISLKERITKIEQTQYTDHTRAGANRYSIVKYEYQQSFKLSEGGYLTKVAFCVSLYGDLPVVWFVGLRPSQDGNFTVSEVLNGDLLTDDPTWVEWNISPPILLEKNKTYWLCNGCTVPPVGEPEIYHFVETYYTNSDVYNNGSMGTYFQSYSSLGGWLAGTPTTDENADLAFKIWVKNYPSAGYIISPSYEAGPNSIFNTINCIGTIPEGTSIKVQIASSDDNTLWTFRGPNGNTNTYYTFDNDNSGTNQTINWEGHNGNLYVKWRAILETSNNIIAPKFKSVTIRMGWKDEVVLDSDNNNQVNNQWEGLLETCYYNHPLYSKDLDTVLLPVPSGTNIIRSNPFFSITNHTNSNVFKSITTENAYYQLKGETNIIEDDWDSRDDQLLEDGLIISNNNIFNDSSNPQDFFVESDPVTISSSYPEVEWVEDEIKNKFSFWEDDANNLIDNPYVRIDSSNWDIHLYYPNGSQNNDLSIARDLSKPSNNNPETRIYNDFTIRITTGACPREFIELRGNTSTLGDGFISYSLFYRSLDNNIWQSIPVYSDQPVLNNGVLAYWDVSKLNGEYEVKLVVLDNTGQNEAFRQVTIGTLVPGGEHASPPAYVTAPFNKAWLEFPSGALESDTYVTITPVRLEDTDIVLDPNMPHPIGAFYMLKPGDIAFQKDENNNVLHPASISVRFMYEELTGIDPATLTIYHVEEDGSLESLDVHITYDTNGNGQFDPDEIVTVTSPVESFSYYLVIPSVASPELDPIVSPTNQRNITVTGRSEGGSTVGVFVNGASVGTMETDDNDEFSLSLSLVEGNNLITATATRWFGGVAKTSDFSEPMIVILDLQIPKITNVSDLPDPFSPDGDNIRDKVNLSYTLSEDTLVGIKIYNETGTEIKTLLDDSLQSIGPNSTYWDGTDNSGIAVSEGIYTYTITAHDIAGNPADPDSGEIEVTYTPLPPPPPVLLSPENEGFVNEPVFSLMPDETVERVLKYKIQLSTDNFNTQLMEFDQTVSETGWAVDFQTFVTTFTASEVVALSDDMYFWRVYAFDDTLWSDPSEIRSFTLDTEPPPIPELISPFNYIEIANPRPEFDWTDVVDNNSGINSYEIQVDNNDSFDSPEFSAEISSSTVVPLENLLISTYYWRVRAKDNAGNYSGWSSVWNFTRVNAPPLAPDLIFPGDWEMITVSTPTFRMISSDPDEDPIIYKLEISSDNFNSVAYLFIQPDPGSGWDDERWVINDDETVDFTLAEEDPLTENIYTWRVQAYDGTDWSSFSSTRTFVFDTNSPLIIVEAPQEGQLFVPGQNIIDINFLIQDLDPDPIFTAWLIHTEGQSRIDVVNHQEIQPLDIDDGFWEFKVEAEDWAGNISSATVRNLEVTHDVLPPRTTITVGEPNYIPHENPVNVRSVSSFTLTAVDDYTEVNDGIGRGVSSTEYKIDDGDWVIYESSFTLNIDDGLHIISYRSTDVVEHQEQIKTLEVLIDNISPTTQLIPSEELYNDGVNNFALLSYTYAIAVFENGIDLDHIDVNVDDEGWIIYTSSISFGTGGLHTIQYRAIDMLGNPEEEKDFSVVVDTTVPVTELRFDDSIYNSDDEMYVNSQTNFYLETYDPQANEYSSQIKNSYFRVIYSSEVPYIMYDSTFNLTGVDGDCTVEFYSIDNVGNQEQVNSYPVNLDNTPPNIELLISDPKYVDGDIVWISSATKISILPDDGSGSGVYLTEYKIDDGTFTVVSSDTENFVIDAGGSHVLSCRSRDNLDNTIEKTFSIHVDTTPPVTTLLTSQAIFTNESDDTIIPMSNATSFEIFEEESGVSRIEYRINQGDWILFTVPIMILEEGSHTIWYRAIDNIGNQEEVKEFSFFIDAHPPEIVSVYPKNNDLVYADEVREIIITFTEGVRVKNDYWNQAVSIKHDNTGDGVDGVFRYEAQTYNLYFKMDSLLDYSVDYGIGLNTFVTDMVGNPFKGYESVFTVLLEKHKGGTIVQNEVTIVVPPDALEEDGVIRIQKEGGYYLNNVPKPLTAFTNEIYNIFGYSKERKPFNEKLLKNIDITINYGMILNTPASSAGQHQKQITSVETLRLFVYNEAEQIWELVKGSANDTEKMIVSAPIDRFGIYAVIGFAVPGDSLEDLTNFPNPFPAYGREDTTIQYYLKEDADIKIVIYDLLGNLVRKFDVSKGTIGQAQGGIENQIIWDGKNGNGEFVANGGYICIVKMNTGEQTKVKKRKILVIK